MSYLQIEKDAATGVAIIWFDQPEEKVNKLSIDMLEHFQSLLQELEQDQQIQAVIFASKKDSFIAGADIHKFLELTDAREAADLSRQANEMFQRLAAFPKPTICAIHGACLGGGTEMALACDYRIASDHPKTLLALPEVKIGLLPGAGGTQRLPRLIGIQRSLEMMLTGKNIYSRPARKYGLVDEIIHPAGLIDAAKKVAVRLMAKPYQRKRKLSLLAKVLESRLLRWLIFRMAGKQVLRQTGGHYPAPLQILACVRDGMNKGMKKGFALESERFGKLAVSPEGKQLMRLFFNMNEHKKNPQPEQTHAITKVGILGAGFMGAGIANVTIDKDIPVLLKDISDKTLESAEKSLWQDLTKKVQKKALTTFQRDAIMSRVFCQTDYHGFDKADLVIEAVFEEIELKRKVLAETEAQIRADCVFASNTSSLPISAIAANAQHPERVLGMHYFSPVPAMPLLEIIVTEKTADWALATAYALGMKQGKTIIVVNDGPGFYTTRILAPFINEAVVLLGEGAAIEDVDKAMKKFGFPVGPLALIDEVGIDVGAHVSRIMGQYFTERGVEPDHIVEKLSSEGYQGRKSGKGFYAYPTKKGKKKQVNREIYRFFGGSRRKRFAMSDIQDRLALVMINEAALCLQEQIIRTPADGDIGAIFGMGFPPFLGGPFRYIDCLGITRLLEKLDALAQQHQQKYQAAALLRDKAQKQEKFYSN